MARNTAPKAASGKAAAKPKSKSKAEIEEEEDEEEEEVEEDEDTDEDDDDESEEEDEEEDEDDESDDEDDEDEDEDDEEEEGEDEEDDDDEEEEEEPEPVKAKGKAKPEPKKPAAKAPVKEDKKPAKSVKTPADVKEDKPKKKKEGNPCKADTFAWYVFQELMDAGAKGLAPTELGEKAVAAYVNSPTHKSVKKDKEKQEQMKKYCNPNPLQSWNRKSDLGLVFSGEGKDMRVWAPGMKPAGKAKK